MSDYLIVIFLEIYAEVYDSIVPRDHVGEENISGNQVEDVIDPKKYKTVQCKKVKSCEGIIELIFA